MYSTSALNTKPAIVERFNRTMKEIMWKYFQEHNTNKWNNVLGDIVNLYNNWFHKTLRMTRTEAREEENFVEVYNEMSSWIRSLQRMSTLISVSDEKIRATYFNTQRNFIDLL